MTKIPVAIVDDTEDIRDALYQIVQNSNEFTCTGVYENAEDALEGIPAIKPRIVLMDINLPGISGIECVKRLRDVVPQTMFVMCTVFQDDDNIFDALKFGASGYLLKNAGAKKIVEALRELADGGAPMSSVIARRVVQNFYEKQQTHKQLDALSPRENEVLNLLASGLMYKEIASRISISVETVRRHVHNIYEKLHVQTRTEAINVYYGK
jgi:RNA polymerase sigma factor (sigma-70 family)